MSKNSNAIEILYEQIRIIVERLNLKNDKTIQTSIIEQKDEKYKVRICGSDYVVENGTGRILRQGQKVWVMAPGGDYSKLFIFAAR